MKSTELSGLPIPKNSKELQSEELSNIKRKVKTQYLEAVGFFDDTSSQKKSGYQKYQLFISFIFFCLGVYFLYYIFSYIYSQYVSFYI